MPRITFFRAWFETHNFQRQTNYCSETVSKVRFESVIFTDIKKIWTSILGLIWCTGATTTCPRRSTTSCRTVSGRRSTSTRPDLRLRRPEKRGKITGTSSNHFLILCIFLFPLNKKINILYFPDNVNLKVEQFYHDIVKNK